jgi:putative transcription factor
MACEMCGRPLPVVGTIDVEGARMRVCQGCMRFGKPVAEPSAPGPEATPAGRMERGLRQRQQRMAERSANLESDEDLVADFGERVRRARQAKRLKVEDVARAINEKASIVQKIESGTFHPDPVVTAKLERALGVRLREKVEEVHTAKPAPSGGLTIGDLIRMQKK